MANLDVKDYSGAQKYLKSSGAGTDGDPHIVEHLDTNSAAMLTALQAIQTAVELIDNMISGAEAQVDIVTSALPSGAATEATLATIVAAEAAALGSGVLIQGDDGTDRKNINVDATTGDVQVDVTNTVTVDGSGVTQPVSGTITANLSATDNAVLDAIAASVAGTLTVDGSGVTQPVSGTVTANLSATDNAVLDTIATPVATISATPLQRVAIFDAADNQITTFGGSGGTSSTDDGAFTAGSGLGTPAMGYFSVDTVDSGDVGVLAMDASRRLMVSIEADNVGIGGGTQYTEGNTDATITGNAMLMEGAADTLLPVQGTVADGLLVNLGTNNDVTVTGTVDLGATDNAVLDTIASPVATISATPLQRVAIFDAADAQITSFGGGTQYTFGTSTYAEATNIGTMAGAVRNDTLAALANTDNEIAPLQVNASGALYVDVASGSALGTDYSEDAATPATITGPALMMERDDALATVTPIEGDWIGARGTAEGALWTQDFNSDATLTAAQAIQTAVELIDNAVNGTNLSIDWNGTAPPIGAGTEAAALRVTIANNSTGLVSVDDGGGTLTVDGTVDLGATDNAVLDTIASPVATISATPLQRVAIFDATDTQITSFGGSGGTAMNDDAAFTVGTTQVTPMGALVDETTPDSADEGDIGAPRMTADRKLLTRIVGATDGNRVDVDASGHLQVDIAADSVGIGGGTQYTLGTDTYTEATSIGTIAGAVRNDTLAALVNTDNEVAPLQVNASGALYVDGSDVTQPVSGTVTANAGTGTFTVDGSGVTQPISAASLPLPTGAATEATLAALGAAEATALGVGVLLQGDDGTDRKNINVDATTGDVQVDVTNTVTVSGTVTADAGTGPWPVTDNSGSLTVDNAGTFAVQVDGSALTALQLIDNSSVNHDAAVVAGVTQIGLAGRSTSSTAVNDGDAVRALATLLGKQITVPYAIPANTWSYAASGTGGITNTTAVTIKAAAGAGIRNYLTSLQVLNAHATVGTEVVIRDGASGTVLHRGWAEPTGGGYASRFDPPIRGTANTLMEVACITTGSATHVSAQGFVAAE